MELLVGRISRIKLQYGKLEYFFLSSPLVALLNFFFKKKLDILSDKIVEWLEIFMICILSQSLVGEGGLHMCGNYSKTAFCHCFLLGQWSTPDKHLVYVLTGICELLSWLIFAFAKKVESEDLVGCICISVYTKCRFNYGK